MPLPHLTQSTTHFPWLAHSTPPRCKKRTHSHSTCFLENLGCRNALRNGEMSLKNWNCLPTQWSKVFKIKKSFKVFIWEIWWPIQETGRFVPHLRDSGIIQKSWHDWHWPWPMSHCASVPHLQDPLFLSSGNDLHIGPYITEQFTEQIINIFTR